MADHVYERAGNQRNQLFESDQIELQENKTEVEIVDDFGDISKTGNPTVDQGEEEIKEASNKVFGFIHKYKFFLRLLLMNMLYLRSLESCNDTYKHCFDKMHSHFAWWGIYIFIAALIFVNTVISTIREIYFSIRDQLWDDINESVGKLIMLIANYYFLCALKPGFNFKHHGSLSRIFFAMIIIKILMFKATLIALKYISRKSKIIKNLTVTMFLLVVIFHNINQIYWTRDKFFEGFMGHTLEHGPHLMAFEAYEKMTGKKLPGSAIMRNKHLTGICRFNKIGVNWYEAFDEFFWKFSHQKSDCKTRDINVDWIRSSVKDFKSDLKYVAYPRSENMENDIRQHYGLFRDEHIHGMTKIDNLASEEASHFHSFLDFTESQYRPKMKFSITRNQTLINQMKEVRKKNPKLKRPNVLILMLDSLSRQHFFRKLPKSVAYFNQFFGKRNSHDSQSIKHTAYQFFRFHGLRQHHMANLLALRYDDRETWEAKHSWERFENNYKDEGYITASASSLCEVDEYDLNMTTKSKVYADKKPLDYEYFGAACDPNSMPNHSLDGFKNALKGPFSEFRRCMYGEDSTKHQLDFTLEFWRKYKSEPKVQMVTLMDAHEFTGELAQYLDEHIPQFFNKMINEGLLEDSIVFVMSNHGNNANLFFKGTSSGKNELANPFLMMMLSENNDKLYGEHLRKNEQKLLSPHDINRVLNELIGVGKEYTGLNFMRHEVDSLRTCGNAMIPPEFCRCSHTDKEFEFYKKHKYEFESKH